MLTHILPLKIIPQNSHVRFMGKKWLAFALSALLILGAFGLVMIRGINFGIDFTGGVVIEIRTETEADLGSLRTVLSSADLGEIALQHVGSSHDIMIRIEKDSEADQTKTIETAKALLVKELGDEVDFRKVDLVGPQVGKELITAGAMSLLFSFAAIMIYIWVRFEWQFGLGAIIALIHDTILTVGFFAYLQLEFNLTSVAAILTIIGYSINDSVVIYDRIRENLRKYKKMPLDELLDISINDTLSRTILTAGTTIAALVALVLFGGEVIRGFSLAVLFGIVTGTYSSIYIAAPLLTFTNIRRQ